MTILPDLQQLSAVQLRDDYGTTLVLGPPLVLDRQQAERAASAVIEVLSRLDGDGRLAPR